MTNYLRNIGQPRPIPLVLTAILIAILVSLFFGWNADPRFGEDATRLNRLKFEVDYFKYLGTLAGAGIALAAALSKDREPKSWLPPIAIASFAVALFFVTCGYAYKSRCVVSASRSLIIDWVDPVMGLITAAAFIVGFICLVSISVVDFHAAWVGPKSVRQSLVDFLKGIFFKTTPCE